VPLQECKKWVLPVDLVIHSNPLVLTIPAAQYSQQQQPQRCHQILHASPACNQRHSALHNLPLHQDAMLLEQLGLLRPKINQQRHTQTTLV
jgi:hypothetical protein